MACKGALLPKADCGSCWFCSRKAHERRLRRAAYAGQCNRLGAKLGTGLQERKHHISKYNWPTDFGLVSRHIFFAVHPVSLSTGWQLGGDGRGTIRCQCKRGRASGLPVSLQLHPELFRNITVTADYLID